MGCNTSAVDSSSSKRNIQSSDSAKNEDGQSQISTSEDELLIYGWTRENTNDNIPTDMMHKCLQFYRDNEWIRPNIQCRQHRKGMTKEQLEMINHVLISCYKKDQSLSELIENTRHRLTHEFGMSALVTKLVKSSWGWHRDLPLNKFKDSSWKVDDHHIRIWCTKPKPRVDRISCINRGNINEEQYDIILTVLEYCSVNDKMTATNIKDELHKKGVMTIVIRDCKELAWKHGFFGDKISLSQWKSKKYGFYSILLLIK